MAADRSPRVVRIVARGDDDLDEHGESWGRGLPGFWLVLGLLFVIAFFVGLHVPLLFWGVR